MNDIGYSDSPISIRPDLVAAHQRAWSRLAEPGRWWTSHERLAIAAEARHAAGCSLCAARKAALSPYSLDGRHDSLHALPDKLIEVVHRVVTDPGRLTQKWYQRIVEAELREEEYVEAVAVTVTVIAVDTFSRALGLPMRPLPAPRAGTPSRRRPAGAKHGGAWVPWIEQQDVTASEAGLYPPGRPPANIRKALSLVPEEAVGFFDLVETQYLPGPAMREFGKEFRAISHAQIEFVAGRVSAINGCEY